MKELKPIEVVKSISDCIFRMSIDSKNAFYSLYLNCLQKDVTKSIPTMAIALHQLDYKLVANPYFWQSLNQEEKKGLLCHEILHVIWNHPIESKNYEDPKLFNEAADLYINYHLLKEGRRLPCDDISLEDYKAQYEPLLEDLRDRKDSLTKEEFEKEFYSIPMRGVYPDNYDQFTDEEIEKGTHYIYNKLHKVRQEQEDPNQNLKDLLDELGKGNEDEWKDAQSSNKEKAQIVSNQVKHRTKSVAESIEADKSQGAIPGHLRNLIDSILNPPKPITDWKREIKNWIGGFGIANIISRTHMRPHLLIPDQPVLRIKRNKHLALCWDTSASVSSEELVIIAKECLNIKKNTGCKITIIECDAYVDEENGVYELKSIKQVEERLNKGLVTGGGGIVCASIDRNIYSQLQNF